MARAQKLEDLEVWQKAHVLVLQVYETTRSFPDRERFELVAQMRSSAVSITANIAEGFARMHRREKVRFYNISQGSVSELRYYFILCRDLKYLPSPDGLLAQIESVSMMLNRLVSVIAEAIDR